MTGVNNQERLGWTREVPTEPGFYWVRVAGMPYVLHFDAGEWFFPGWNIPVSLLRYPLQFYLPRLIVPADGGNDIPGLEFHLRIVLDGTSISSSEDIVDALDSVSEHFTKIPNFRFDKGLDRLPSKDGSIVSSNGTITGTWEIRHGNKQE